MKIKDIFKIYIFDDVALINRCRFLNYLKIVSKKLTKKEIKELLENNQPIMWYGNIYRISTPEYSKFQKSYPVAGVKFYDDIRSNFLFEDDKIYVKLFHGEEYLKLKKYLKDYDCRIDFKVYKPEHKNLYNEIIFYNTEDKFKFKLLL